jgi:hypothetical protein
LSAAYFELQIQQMGAYLGIKQDEDPYIWQNAHNLLVLLLVCRLL